MPLRWLDPLASTDGQLPLVPSRSALLEKLAALEPPLEPSLAACRHLDPPLDEATLDALWRAELFALTVPSDAGGQGANLRDFCAVMHGVGRLGPAWAMAAVPHLCISVKAVAELAQQPLRKQVLDGVVHRRELLAFAITEDQGSDLAAMQTRLVRDAQGQLRLQGRKQWITNLDRARYVVVAARHRDVSGGLSTPGYTLVLVDAHAPGVQVQPDAWRKRCVNGTATGDLYFDDVLVAPQSVLGEPGQGMSCFQRLVQSGRLGAAATLVGMADAALDACAPRLAFPLQALWRAELHLARAQILSCASWGDAGDADFQNLAALVKHAASTQAQHVLEQLAEIFRLTQQRCPPVLARAQRAAGLFRLLKGPGEVIAQQALASALARARSPLTLAAALAPRLRWGLVRLRQQLIALGQGGLAQQPQAANQAVDTAAALHGLWAAQHLGREGVLKLTDAQRQSVRRLAWRRLRSAAERVVVDDPQALAQRFESQVNAMNGHAGVFA